MSATTTPAAANVDVSALLLPVAGELLVVPSVSVSEIIRPRPLERSATAPNWLLGTFQWHGQRLRVLSFEALNNNDKPSPLSASRLVIFNLMVPTAEGVGQYALLTHGVPHLMRLTPDNLIKINSALLGPAERMKVSLYGQDGAIPDIDYLERHAIMPLGSVG